MGFQDVLFQSFEERGWAVSDRIVPPSLAQALRNHAHQLWQQGFFKPASIGRQAELVRDPDIRGDAICWIDDNTPFPPCAEFLAWTDALRQELNRHFFLSLRGQEFHFAHYEPGRGYARHMDQHGGTSARKVSLVLYLNEDWKAEDGGELCLYGPETGDGEPGRDAPAPSGGDRQPDPGPNAALEAKVLPESGRLALFLSDRVPHEVLPARRVRWSLTGWFRDDAPL